MHQHCLPFYDGIVLCCVDAPHFLYPLIYWGTLVLLPPTLFKPFLTGSHPHQSTQTALSEITNDPHVAISHGWSQSSLDLYYQQPLACQSLSLLKSLLDLVGSTCFFQIFLLPLWNVLSCLLYCLSPLFYPLDIGIDIDIGSWYWIRGSWASFPPTLTSPMALSAICIWTPFAHLILLRFEDTRVLYKLNVYGSTASSKSSGAIFPTAFAHFMSLCCILVILEIFKTFSSLLSLLWWLWSVISDATFAKILWLEHSDDGQQFSAIKCF